MLEEAEWGLGGSGLVASLVFPRAIQEGPEITFNTSGLL